MVHSPTEPIPVQPTPVLHKKQQTQESKLWERSLCLANQQDKEAASKTLQPESIPTVADADVHNNRTEFGRLNSLARLWPPNSQSPTALLACGPPTLRVQRNT